MVNSVEFAAYLQKKADKDGYEPNMTKVQKWLYICYGLYLAVRDEQLLDEKPRAWQYGPVFLDVYKEQKSRRGLRSKVDDVKLSEYDDVIKATLDNFGTWTASQLVHWTHEPKGAWDKQYYGRERHGFMDNHDILKEFNERLFATDEN